MARIYHQECFYDGARPNDQGAASPDTQGARQLGRLHLRRKWEVDPAVVVTDPGLYCLDDETRRAVFAQLPPGVDLTKSPFVYLTQGEQAERRVAVPYDDFVQLAAELPKVGNFILVRGGGDHTWRGGCGTCRRNRGGGLAGGVEPFRQVGWEKLRDAVSLGLAPLKELPEALPEP